MWAVMSVRDNLNKPYLIDLILSERPPFLEAMEQNGTTSWKTRESSIKVTKFRKPENYSSWREDIAYRCSEIVIELATAICIIL